MPFLDQLDIWECWLFAQVASRYGSIARTSLTHCDDHPKYDFLTINMLAPLRWVPELLLFCHAEPELTKENSPHNLTSSINGRRFDRRRELGGGFNLDS
jgi:hypothetical protein